MKPIDIDIDAVVLLAVKDQCFVDDNQLAGWMGYNLIFTADQEAFKAAKAELINRLNRRR